ncbi:YjjG family noncanonical pyrimidine nucleotidase [bacterium SCSIO 12643]|nr:YjjG family noncanonical pyrimidine nucleotidase [bacterium SCSIO 12643]
MRKYKHIFFDLDHTLWDFKTNSRLALKEIYVNFDLNDKGVSQETDFIDIYEKYNHKMWADYRNGKMSKETLRTERFRQSLSHLGVKDKNLSKDVADYYVEHSPYKTALFPNAIDVLKELSSNYTLHIITNGFEEIQAIKIENSGLSSFFEEIITSEQAGYKKPDPAIFRYSLNKTNAQAKESLMIGDNQLVDIEGAKKVGMDGILFNPEKEDLIIDPTYEVNHLNEILSIL